MNHCTNRELGQLLDGYELGILSEQEKASFELHLIECDYCHSLYSEYEKVSRHICHSPAIRREIAKIAASPDTESKEKRSFVNIFAPGNKIRPIFLPGMALVVLALLFFILKPWQLEFRSSQEAIASGNRLAIIDFVNITSTDDSLRTGSIIAHLLATDLSRLPSISLVSSERVKDILNNSRQTVTDINNPTAAIDFAKTAEIRWLLYGSVIDKDGKFILTTQLTDAVTGNVVSGHRLLSEDNETIFSIVDRLAVLTVKDLSLPMKIKGNLELPMAPASSRSLDALRYYLEGVDYYEKYYYDDAERCFEKALSYDSTFAMAYYCLSYRKDPTLINKAIKYKNGASNLEQYYIDYRAVYLAGKYDSARVILDKLINKYPDEKSAYYFMGTLEYHLRNFTEAIGSFGKAIEIDPSFKIVYNDLAYTYDKLDNYEMALWAINKYIELAPNEANPYDTRGELYATHGFPDKAVQSYLKAIEIKPDFYSSIEYVGHIYLQSREYSKADSCYRILETAESKFTSTMSGFLRTLIPYNKGKLDSALYLFDSCLAIYDMSSFSWSASRVHYLKSFIYQARHDYMSALSENEKGRDIELVISLGKIPDFRDFHIQLLAQSGQMDRARIAADSLKLLLENNNGSLHDYWYGMAAIAFEQNDFNSCIAYINNIFRSDEVCRCFPVHYLLGRAYLELDRLADAIKEFEGQINIYDYLHVRHAAMLADIHYYLGVAYEKSNWNDKAIEQYQLFLDIFKDADADLMALYDVKTRLNHLRQIP